MDTKDLEKSLLNDIPIFRGEDDVAAILTWARLAERVGKVLSSNRINKMWLLSGKLQGNASTWFDKYLSQHEEGEENLTDMIADFKDYYLPPDFERLLMTELVNLKQITSVSVYNRQFDRIVNHLSEISQKQLLNLYIEGLKREIRIVVVSTSPLTWLEAQRTADKLDRASYGTARAVKKFIGIESQPRNINKDVTPTYKTQENHKRSRVSTLKGSPPKRPITCWFCRKEGHYQRDCPKMMKIHALLQEDADSESESEVNNEPLNG